jgi:hypothetical protein
LRPVLDYEAELQTIFDAVDRARRKGPVEVQILEVGHPDEIQRAFEEQSFHVLHLTGHGNAGVLEFEDEDGRAVPVTAAELAEAIRSTGRPLPLVVLASCLSGAVSSETVSLAQGLLEAGIPSVLAMQTSVSDWYATRLAGAFYEHLARLDSPLPSHALALARQEVERERQQMARKGTFYPAEYATPALFSAADDESPLLDRSAPPQSLHAPRPKSAGGPVPLLKLGDLVGRRRELRRVLRILRDDPRSIEAQGRKAGVALLGQREDAEQFYKNALDIRERLVKAEPNRADYLSDLAVSCSKMGDLLRSLEKGQDADQFYRKDLDITEQLAKAEPNRADHQTDLVISLINIAQVEPANAPEAP